MPAIPPQSTIPTLWHLSSSQSNRVLWALEELKEANGLEYNLKSFARQKSRADPDLKKAHPLGKAPILTIDSYPSSSTTQSAPTSTSTSKTLKTIVESRLVLLFIGDNYANGLWTPRSSSSVERDLFFQEFANGFLKGKVESVLLFDIIPSQLPFFIRPLGTLLVSPVVKIMKTELPPVFQILEDALSDELPWFSGEKIGLADFNVSWSMDVADARGYFDRSKFPRLREWHERIRGRDAYKRALAIGGEYDLINFK